MSSSNKWIDKAYKERCIQNEDNKLSLIKIRKDIKNEIMEVLDVKVIFILDINKIGYQGEGCLSNEVRCAVDKAKKKE